MNHEIKKIIIDAIMKVVDSAPSKKNTKLNSYNPYDYKSTNPFEVTKEEFDIWIDYVLSIIKIASKHIDMNLCLSIQKNINNIVSQQGDDYMTKTNTICQMLLNFARQIINL